MRLVSMRTSSTFAPALNVMSTTLPVLSSLSFVRTNAPPLPGFTCWNSTMIQRLPSYSMHMPFLNWFVLTATANLLRVSGSGGRLLGAARPR